MSAKVYQITRRSKGKGRKTFKKHLHRKMRHSKMENKSNKKYYTKYWDD